MSRHRGKRQRYGHRAVLRILGYNSYTEYLNGSIWSTIRQHVLTKHPDCYACSKTATQVHHTTYSPAVLSGESHRGLLSLCWSCHELAHRSGRGRKRPGPAASKWLRRRRQETLNYERKHQDLDDAAVLKAATEP